MCLLKVLLKRLLHLLIVFHDKWVGWKWLKTHKDKCMHVVVMLKEVFQVF